MAPAAIPTANPIMKPIFTRSKQLGWVWPYGPTATGIWRGNTDGRLVRDYTDQCDPRARGTKYGAALKLPKLVVISQTTS